jgi:hypothetical protein
MSLSLVDASFNNETLSVKIKYNLLILLFKNQLK